MSIQPATRRFQCFASAQDAWFWTMAALRARRDGAGRGGQGIARPCDPDDNILCLDRLYRSRRIDASHAHILRVWGERQVPPDALERPADECRLWREAMAYLDAPLRAKGIIN
jgi:hypothetical protein